MSNMADRLRPKSWRDIKGQPEVVKELKSYVKKHHFGKTAKKREIPGAYFFMGIYGSGKTTLAGLFSMALNCEHIKKNADPCGKCVSCEVYLNDDHPDINELNGTADGQKGVIKDLIKQTAYPPRFSMRINIIEEAHGITTDAKEALLRPLEKVPTHVAWMFVSTEQLKFKDTQSSRFCKLDIQRVDKTSCVEILQRACDIEELDFSEKILSKVAKAYDYNPRDALTGLESMVAKGATRISSKKLAKTLKKYLSASFGENMTGILTFMHFGKFGDAYSMIRDIPDSQAYNHLTQLVQWHQSLLDLKLGYENAPNLKPFSKKLYRLTGNPELTKILEVHELLMDAYYKASTFQLRAGFILVDLLNKCVKKFGTLDSNTDEEDDDD